MSTWNAPDFKSCNFNLKFCRCLFFSPFFSMYQCFIWRLKKKIRLSFQLFGSSVGLRQRNSLQFEKTSIRISRQEYHIECVAKRDSNWWKRNMRDVKNNQKTEREIAKTDEKNLLTACELSWKFSIVCDCGRVCVFAYINDSLAYRHKWHNFFSFSSKLFFLSLAFVFSIGLDFIMVLYSHLPIQIL